MLEGVHVWVFFFCPAVLFSEKVCVPVKEQSGALLLNILKYFNIEIYT